MQVCTLLQTDNHASTPTAQLFTGRMPFLPPNQQCQSTEGKVPGSNRSISPARWANSSKPAAAECGRQMGQTGGWREKWTSYCYIDPAPHTMLAALKTSFDVRLRFGFADHCARL